MNAKDRILQFIESKELTKSEFERRAGLSNGYVNNFKGNFGADKLESILKTFPELSKDWLLTGVGEMLSASGDGGEPAGVVNPSADITSENIIMVPVVNLDARGGFLPNEEVDTLAYISRYMPFSRSAAREGDFVVPIFGDSMAPKYPSGSQALVRRIEMWREYVEFGASYVLELVDSRRLIKNLQKGRDGDHFLLVSINKDYEPAEIAKKMISNVFKVIMAVRMESM